LNLENGLKLFLYIPPDASSTGSVLRRFKALMGFGAAQLLRPELGGSKGGSVGIGPNLNAGFVGVELDGDRNAGFLGGSGLVEISRAGFVGSDLDE
jgi:hypothetical protein